MKDSKELTAFKSDFEINTGIKVLGTIEERTFFIGNGLFYLD